MHKYYKKIVILSGKGGTGKTTISAAFASLIEKKVLIDCDVDAANLHLVLKPEIKKDHNFFGGKKAYIDKDKCDECGLCQTFCRFDAINNFTVDKISCEGCGFCFRICPLSAIQFNFEKSGSYYECLLPDKSKFYYARLLPGEGNSGKLVSEIKRKALKNISTDTEWIIIDGPPGIGCPVNASIASTDYAVVVTEPTLSGLHDLKRLVELLKKFKIGIGIIINKSDLNDNITCRIIKYADCEGISLLGTIPFNSEFVTALINGKNIAEVNRETKEDISAILKRLELQLEICTN